MGAARSDLPTLTEVVELKLNEPAEVADLVPSQAESVALEVRDGAPEPLPFEATSPQSLAYDEELVAQVMVRLQPRLEAWVEAQVRRALGEMLPVWTESASLSIVRELRAEMPELLSIALDEVHRQRHG
jgi:hypothetical protein